MTVLEMDLCELACQCVSSDESTQHLEGRLARLLTHAPDEVQKQQGLFWATDPTQEHS